MPERCRRLYELVCQHPSADETLVAMQELARGNGRPGARSVGHRLVEQAESADIGVALKACADQGPAQLRHEQEPGRLDSSGRQHDRAGPHVPGTTNAVLGHQRNARRPPWRASEHLCNPGADQDRAMPRSRRIRQHRIVGPGLGVDGACETNALRAANAGGAPTKGGGIDHQRYRGGGPAKALGTGRQAVPSSAEPDRRKRVTTAPVPGMSVAGLTCHP